MDPTLLASLGIGLIGSIGKMFGRHAANKQLGQLASNDPTYTANPVVSQRLALANSLLNARMPGAASIEKNIYGTQANTVANINRNATDSSQALALASGAQGQSNSAFNNLGIEEAQDYQRRLGNLNTAQEAQVNEGDKMYQDRIRRWQDLVGIKGAQQQNNQANWGDISNLGFGLTNFGLSGGFGKMFGGGTPGGAGGSGMGGNTGNFFMQNGTPSLWTP